MLACQTANLVLIQEIQSLAKTEFKSQLYHNKDSKRGLHTPQLPCTIGNEQCSIADAGIFLPYRENEQSLFMHYCPSFEIHKNLTYAGIEKHLKSYLGMVV